MTSEYRHRKDTGYTLLEILVVLVLLGLSAALAVPVLSGAPRRAAPLRDLVARARETAIERGEVVYLRLEPDGAWSIEGGAGTATAVREGVLARGRIASPVATPTTLRVAPLGSCAFDVRSLGNGPAFVVDLPSCDVRER
jgi:prepilin-type N-terminal cleavage/methylation domain-containing protein